MEEIMSAISNAHSVASDPESKHLLSELRTHAAEVRDKIAEIIGSPIVPGYPEAKWESSEVGD